MVDLVRYCRAGYNIRLKHPAPDPTPTSLPVWDSQFSAVINPSPNSSNVVERLAYAFRVSRTFSTRMDDFWNQYGTINAFILAESQMWADLANLASSAGPSYGSVYNFCAAMARRILAAGFGYTDIDNWGTANYAECIDTLKAINF